jgi:hypothetical protein
MSTTHFAQRLSETLYMVVAMNIAPFNSPYQDMAHAECENSFDIEFYPMRRQNCYGSDEVFIKADVETREAVEAGRKYEIQCGCRRRKT